MYSAGTSFIVITAMVAPAMVVLLFLLVGVVTIFRMPKSFALIRIIVARLLDPHSLLLTPTITRSLISDGYFFQLSFLYVSY